ncbi:MAG TPA: Asd/ArgC dimerization domain-containing protein [Thermoanaerobaculia bacterium]|nr:Asd/ArgC dimerization domain-containing protein [Thermoanaerobaculia bacterium]
MKVAAILNPVGLLAKELREQLGNRPDLVRELRLLTTVEEEVGTLTESAGAAALVQRFSADDLDGVDVLFLCGPAAESRKALADLPARTPAILMSLDATPDDAPPVVAGINLDESIAGNVLSPHPAAILLAHLLHPLREHGLQRAEATLLQPVSIFPAEALDQLFEQARSLLTFQPVVDSPHWPRQLAFNVVATESTADNVRAEVEAVLGSDVAISAQILQAGIFHGFAASVHLAFDPDPGATTLRDAYTNRPFIRWADEDPLGPLDAASTDDVLLGHLRPDGPGSYWLWSVMDNLTRGGATNAVAIAEALLR